MTNKHSPQTPGRRNQQTVNEIRALMAARHKTSADLAQALGVSQSTASRLLTSKRPISFDDAQVIADWLGVPYERITTPQQLAYTA